MGATRWEMIRGAVFPHSRNGAVAAFMIGLGRGVGETIAVALVVGASPRVTANILGPGDTMASIIANQFGEASGIQRSALIGLGLLLLDPDDADRDPRPHGARPGRSATGAAGMTGTAVDVAPPRPSIFESPPHHVGRRIRNGLATFLIIAAVVVALIPLVFVLLFVIQKGGEIFSWDFLTQDIPISAREFGGGMWPAIVGTIVITAGADAHGGSPRDTRRHLHLRVRHARASSPV